MKQLIIFLLLFSLFIVLAFLMDTIQGLGIKELIHSFIIIGEAIKGEEIVLIILFFVPLIIAKAYDYKKKSAK